MTHGAEQVRKAAQVPLAATAKTKQGISKVVAKQRQAVFERWPLLFTLLATFGLVAILYGFEGIIDTIPLLRENPLMMLVVGVAVLGFTGTLYKRLSN